MYVNPIILLYTLNLHSALNPLYLEKLKEKRRVESTKAWMDKLKDTCEKKYTLEVFDGQYGSEVKKTK